MESNDERKKKLEAGKEKLAAFRKKKAKKKKNSGEKSEKENFSEQLNLNQQNGSGLTPPLISSPTASDSYQTDSDQFSITSGDEFSTEEQEFRGSVFYQAKLVEARRRIAELEETVEGKQLALDALVRETQSQKKSLSADPQSDQDVWEDREPSKISEVEAALAQRDDLIGHLAQSLQCLAQGSDSGGEHLSQLQALGQHVCVLQAQLQQANETLQQQLYLRESSSLALQNAKAQMLQLKAIVISKDSQVDALSQEILAKEEAIQKLSSEAVVTSSNTTVVSAADSSSHVNVLEEKLAEKVRECEVLNANQQQWLVKEEELLAAVRSKSAEIEVLSQSEQNLMQQELQLKQACDELQRSVDELRSDVSESEKISCLEFQLSELRRAHESDVNEISLLNRANEELEEMSRKYYECLSNYESLTSKHTHLNAQYTSCLSEVDLLKAANTDLQTEIEAAHASSAHLVTLQEELGALREFSDKESSEKASALAAFAEAELRFTSETERLKNKVNELQDEVCCLRTELDASHESLRQKAETTHGPVEAVSESVKALSATFTEQESQSGLLNNTEDSMTLSSSLELEKDTNGMRVYEDGRPSRPHRGRVSDESAGVLEKELQVSSITVNELEVKVLELESQNKTLSEEIVRLQEGMLLDSNLSASKIHEKVSSLEAESDSSISAKDFAIQTLKEAESDLRNRCAALSQELDGKCERDRLLEEVTGERDRLLLTVNSLTTDISSLKEELSRDSNKGEGDVNSDWPHQLDKNIDIPALESNILAEEVKGLSTELGDVQAVLNYERQAAKRLTGENTRQIEGLTLKVTELQAALEHYENLNHQYQGDIERLKAALSASVADLAEARQGQLQAQVESHNSVQNDVIDSVPIQVSASLFQAADNSSLMEMSNSTMQQEIYKNEASNEEQDLARNVEELQGQLETTVSQWQRLQIIVQEKEIEVQNLQEELDEQKRICATQRRMFEEELSTVKEELESVTTSRSSEDRWAVEQEQELDSLRVELEVLRSQSASHSEKAVEPVGLIDQREKEDYEARLSDLIENLTARESEIVLLKDSIGANKGIIAELTSKLCDSETQKSDLVTKLTNQTSEMHLQAAEGTRLASERDNQISELTVQVSERDAQITELSSHVNQRDNYISELTTQVSQKDVQISELTNQIMHRDSEITELASHLSEKENNITVVAGQLSEKEHQISGLTSQVSEKDSQISELMSQVNGKDSEIVELTCQTSERDTQIAELSNQVREKEAQISEINVNCSDLDHQVEELKRAVAREEAQKAELCSQSSEREARVSELMQQVSEQGQRIEELVSSLGEKDQQVDVLKAESAQGMADADELKNLKTTKEEEIKALQSRCEEWNLACSESNEQVSELKKSLLEKETEEKELQSRLRSLEEQLKILSSTQVENEKAMLLEKNAEIQNLETLVVEVRSKMSGLESELSEKSETISEMEKTMSDKEAKMQSALSEYETELCELRSVLKDREVGMELLACQLGEKGEQLVELTSHNRHLEGQCHNLKTCVEGKEGNISELKIQLEEAEVSCSELKSQGSDKEDELKSLSVQVSELNGEVMGLTQTLSESQGRISALTDELSVVQMKYDESVRQVSDQGNAISELTSQEELNQVRILELTETLEQKNALVLEKDSALAAVQEELDRLGTSLEDKGTELLALQSSAQEKESQVAKLTDTVARDEQEISDLRNKLVAMEAEMSGREDATTEVQIQCSEQAVRVAEVESMLNEKDNEMDRVSKCMAEKTERIQSLEETVTEQHTKIMELSKVVVDKEEQCLKQQECLEKVERSVQREEDTIQSLRDRASVCESELCSEREKLWAREADLSQLKVSLIRKAGELTGVQETLSSAQTELSQAREQLQLKEERLLEVLTLNSALEVNEKELQEKIKCVSEEFEVMKAQNITAINDLETERQESKRLIHTLEEKAADLESMCVDKTSLEKQVDDLRSEVETARLFSEKVQLEQSERQTSVDERRQGLESELAEVKLQSDSKNAQVAELTERVETLSTQLRHSEGLCQCLKATLSYQREGQEEKDSLAVSLQLQCDHNAEKISDLTQSLSQQQSVVSELEDLNATLRQQLSDLSSSAESAAVQKSDLERELFKLRADLEFHENSSTQYMVENKQLQEKLHQATANMERLEATAFDLRHDCDMHLKDVADLKQELEQKETAAAALTEDVANARAWATRGAEEKELLKANFDSCMEEMQQRLAEQEAEGRRLRCQLTEETRSVHQDQDQVKEMYEQQIALLEEKLVGAERESDRLDKELAEAKAKMISTKEAYELQLSEQELSVQSSSSEVAKLKDQLVKAAGNHECAIAGLKKLHEIQTTELEENCISAERTVAEQKRQINELTMKWKREKNDLEQGFEIQISDMEEKRRFNEMEIARLKRHLDEMKSDHAKEVEHLEKSYEVRLFELEDKFCMATSELERVKKSLMNAEGDFSGERQSLEAKVEDLEATRRDLQVKGMSLEDEVATLRSENMSREEEMKAILQQAAERQQQNRQEMSSEILQLRERLETMDATHSDDVATLKSDYEEQIRDLKSRNNQLLEKVQSMEMHIEHDTALRDSENQKEGDGKEVPETDVSVQSQISSLNEENTLLRRKLLKQKSIVAKLRMKSGVEDICPPYPLTSQSSLMPSLARSESDSGEDCFSPVVGPTSVVEGFVAERSEVASVAGLGSSPSDSLREPDFVAEKSDMFQPEVITERVIEAQEHPAAQLNIHPIRDEIVAEGFQPETPDQFFMETIEEPNTPLNWPKDLSVGLSPSLNRAEQFNFEVIPPTSMHDGKPLPSDSQPENVSSADLVKGTDSTDSNTNCLTSNEHSSQTILSESEFDLRLKHVKEELEEQYVGRLRRQEVDLTHQYDMKEESYRREMEQHFEQKVKAVRYEWERKFTKALQKVRKEMEKRHQKELRRAQLMPAFVKTSPSSQGLHPDDGEDDDDTDDGERASMANQSADESGPGSSETNEGLGEVVEQLHRENQELAEVRDVLLKQIEISQARGLHSRVQHELQSMLTTREGSTSLSSNTSTPTLVPTSPSADKSKGLESDQLDTSGISEEVNSVHSESSSARERFLWELEEMSQQSSQDLPLEWELTSTLPASADFEEEPDQPIGSVWEVFDGRCLRQDCHELDALRGQYEHRLSSLHRQLEAERRGNMEEADARQLSYAQAVSELRARLDQELQENLDLVISQLTSVHTGELQQVEAKHQHDVSVEMLALRVSLEQIYSSKAQLEAAEAQLRHQQQMDTLRHTLVTQHQEEMAKLGHSGADTDVPNVAKSSLTKQYDALIERISNELEEKFLPTMEGEKEDGQDVHRMVPSLPSEELRSLLLSQQQEIASLRGEVLSEYESVLSARASSVQEQSQEMVGLEQQMRDLQQQFEQQLATFNSRLQEKEEEHQQHSSEEKEKLEKQQAEFKSHYEKRIQEMEAAFENEIGSIKDKYEEQISGLIHARLAGSKEQEEQQLSPPLKESVDERSPRNTNLSDTDSDSFDTPRSVPSDLSVQLKQLEAELAERDAQLKELKTQLGVEESRSCSLDTEVSNLKTQVEQLQQEASDALVQCSKLQQLVEEKDSVIRQLEMEKIESEKLYKDLLEKESPRSKDSVHKEHLSGSSVDDSFCSAKEDSRDTPRSGISDSRDTPRSGDSASDFKSPRLRSSDDSEHEDIAEQNDTIPFANDSSEAQEGNSNNNNNNNNSNSGGGTPIEEMVQHLKEKVVELEKELGQAQSREVELRAQIEEKEHGYMELLETVKQELEHDKQMEVETLQSEFRVQLEVELKRQAADLSSQVQTQTQAEGGEKSEPHLPNGDISHSASSDPPTSPPPLRKLSQDDVDDTSSISENIEEGDDLESEPSLMQTSAFELQQVLQASASQVSLGEAADEVQEENLSDDSKATTSAAGSVASPPPGAASSLADEPAGMALPLTDMEKEMEALKEEYEERLAQLKSQLDQLKTEKETVTSTHQEEQRSLQEQLTHAEERYDRLMEGVENGEHPQLNQLMKDKYDEELDLAKSLIQKDFDEALKEEKKKFVERHRKLMTDFMGDRGKEEEEAKEKHDKELSELKQSLTEEFEQKLREYENEIERLKRDLDLFRDMSQESPDGDTGPRDSTLPEIDEITLSFQEESEVQLSSPSSDSRDTSTPVKRPVSADIGIQYEESEEEVEGQAGETLQIRSFAEVVRSPPPLSDQERRENELKVQQLVAQIERLTQQLAERQGAESVSPHGSPQHSPHNDTLRGDDSALVAMLQSDLDRISAERESVQRTNDRLLSLLSDSVKTYVGVEDTINRKLSQVVSGTPRTSGAQADSPPVRSRPPSVEPGLRSDPQGRMGSPAPERYDRKGGAAADGDTSQDSHTLEDTSVLSNATDEGLEISHRLAESIFVGPDLDAEGEEILTDARGRLHTAVTQLLELMERSTCQLIEAKSTQQELLDTLASRAREVETSSTRCTELDAQLAAEIEAKEYLGLELHKAEETAAPQSLRRTGQGLISGYRSEREALDTQVQSLEEQREALIIQLDSTRSRLSEFERSQSEIDSMREEVGHQQELLRENAGQEMQVTGQQTPQATTSEQPALLQEVTSLNQEKRELSTQLQHQLDASRLRLTELETASEEAERRHEAALEERNHALEDMRLQLENMERQLKASRAFVDEQMAEREQEREEHQREIERLQETIEGKDKNANSQQRLQREIADLTEQLQSRITSQSAMHQRTLELQQALEDKELSAHDLKTWVSQLESELDERGDIEDQLKQRITKLERQLTEQEDEKDRDETEDDELARAGRPTGDRTDQDIPTPLSPVRVRSRPSHVSLEDELHTSEQSEEDLIHENRALKEQVHQQLLQISALKNQLDQLRHYGGDDEDNDATQLRLRLQAERNTVENKDAEISDLQSKTEALENELRRKAEEAEAIHAKVSRVLEMGDVQEENQSLKSQLEELQSQVSNMSSLSSQHTLPPALLEEKNHEIEEKVQEVEKLQVNVHSLKQQLKEKEEEISDLQDNIACLRRGEPCLDVSLPLNEETNNMLNISMTGRTSRSARAVTPTSIQQELEDTMAERETELNGVREQLEQTRQELDGLKGSLSSAEQERDELKQSLGQLEEEKEKWSEKEMLKEAELVKLTQTAEELKQQLEEGTKTRQLLEKQLQDREAELLQAQEERDRRQEQVQEKEEKLDQVTLQVDSLQMEIASLTNFQQELQKDFDTVQAMLDEKEKDMESLTKELTDSKSQQETLDTVIQLEGLVASLRKELKEKQNVVEEKEEELYELQDKLDEMGEAKGELEKIKSQLSEQTRLLEKEQQIRKELEEALAAEKSCREESEKQREAEGEEVAEKVRVLEGDVEVKDNKLKEQEEKIEALSNELQEIQTHSEKLEKVLKENKEKSDSEITLLHEKLEVSQKESGTKLSELQEKLKEEGAHTEGQKVLNEQLSNLKAQLEDKEQLQKQLEELVSEKEGAIRDLNVQLSAKEENLDEMRSVQLQMEEMESQLCLRQTSLLDLQAEKDKLTSELEKMSDMKSLLEEKEQTITEIEAQLRFRQTALLDLEAEKEKLLQDQAESEAKLKDDLNEREKVVEELQKKYDELKEGMSEEVLHMEQEMQRSKQARVIRRSPEEEEKEELEKEEMRNRVQELETKLLQASDELVDVSSRLKLNEERLSQTAQQLSEREEQLQQLQIEVQLQQQQEAENNSAQQQKSAEAGVKAEELERLLREAEDRAEQASINAAELSQLKASLELDLEEVRRKEAEKSFTSAEARSDESLLAGTELSRMARWESEPAGLALGHRDSFYLRFRMTEVERMSRQQQQELAAKNQELDRVRSDLETWLKAGKGQDALKVTIKEKETIIVSLQTEIETLKSHVEEKNRQIDFMKDEMSTLTHSSRVDLAAKDHTITELQEQIYVLKNFSSVTPPSSPPRSGATAPGQALSPETKGQISQLKLQLRKAQSALEEMQGRQGSRQETEDFEQAELQRQRELEEQSKSRTRENDVQSVREELQEEHERQMSQLRSQLQQEVDSKVEELQAQHDQDLRELRQLQERKLEQALEEQKENLQQERQTELHALGLDHQEELDRLRDREFEKLNFGNQSESQDASARSSVSGDAAMPERLQALLTRLNQVGEQLLSVSDLRYLQQYLSPASQSTRSPDTLVWSEERRGLMDTIDALKDLHELADRLVRDNEETDDWRSDLVQAMVMVYDKEKRVLSAEVNTSDVLFPEMDIVSQLESRIHDLEQVHQAGLDDMLRADRQSLIDEVDSLHNRLLEAKQHLQDSRDQLTQRINDLEAAKATAEWKLQRQIQLLEYKLQQEGVIQEDLKKSLRLERNRVSELSAQSGQERTRTLELQSELSSTQIQLSKFRDALEREQHRFSSVTLDWSGSLDALEEERAKTNRLNELLDAAKKQLRALQEEVAHTDARQQQRSETEQDYIQGLESELSKERERSCEFSKAEDNAKGEVTRLSEEVVTLKRKLSSLMEDYEEKIESLHREHVEKEVQRRADGESEAVARLSELLDAERESHQAHLEQERATTRQLKHDLEQNRSEYSDLKHRSEKDRSKVASLKLELTQARSELSERRQQTGALEEETDNMKVAAQRQIRLAEQNKEELQQKVRELERELTRVQDRTRDLEVELSTARHMQAGQTRAGGDYHRDAINSLVTASEVDRELKLRLSQCCVKLHGVATQLQGMTETSQRRSSAPLAGSDPGSVQDEALSDVMSELTRLRRELREKEEMAAHGGVQKGDSAAVSPGKFAEVMEHNKQLAEHVLNLKQEKERLTTNLATLESQVQAKKQMSMPRYSSDGTSDEEGVYDRTVWASERLSLQMALDSAEHEIQRLRGEIRQFRSLMNSDGQASRVDVDKSQRLYGKYLRAESFRKALIYQKKYLLLLLGGYRDTEHETLAILASMGGFPSPSAGLHCRRIHTRAFTVFRSAGRVVIAIYRMKYLVKKWKRATRVGSPVMTGQINQNHAYVPSSTSYPAPQRHGSRHTAPSSSSAYTTRSSSDYVESLTNGDISTLASVANPTGRTQFSTYRNNNNHTTPPTKELLHHRTTSSRGDRETVRRHLLLEEARRSQESPSPRTPRQTDSDDDNFLNYLENVQQQLSEGEYSGSPSSSRRAAWR
ncbi:A-kinase anchor protein 9 [Aplysia californica]|uniref:A-kinase anchor protein 9 n=1 Tax=Aplysia californica TaxID=6500 RepID=A0ABM0JGM0_APLCA|nr:A-kinase anchor protein 9 [Aplysia californica]